MESKVPKEIHLQHANTTAELVMCNAHVPNGEIGNTAGYTHEKPWVQSKSLEEQSKPHRPRAKGWETRKGVRASQAQSFIFTQ